MRTAAARIACETTVSESLSLRLLPPARPAARAASADTVRPGGRPPAQRTDAWTRVLEALLGRRHRRVLVATRDTSAADRVAALGHAVDITAPATLDDLPYGSATFDVVLLDGLADGDVDRDLALLECYRVLRRGGRVLVVAPAAARAVTATLSTAGFGDVRDHGPVPALGGAALRPWYRRWIARARPACLTAGVRP